MRKVDNIRDREAKMTYEQIKKLKAKDFKRLCRVKPQLFEEMAQILNLLHK